MMTATSRVLEDADGPFVLLPEGFGFGEGTEVEITCDGEVVTVRRLASSASGDPERPG